MVTPRVETRLHPQAFVTKWQRRSQDFLVAFGDTYFLLVCLDDLSGELSTTLASTLSEEGEPLKASQNGIGFATVSSGPITAVAARRIGQRTLVSRLAQAPHFLMPLRKRPAAQRPFQERIAVGRAPNNDIVLRHASVSKFHAWFERDTDGVFYLHDAGSKNFTTVNEHKLDPRTPLRLEAGDEILFGSVETTLWRPESVLKIISGDR